MDEAEATLEALRRIEKAIALLDRHAINLAKIQLIQASELLSISAAAAKQ